jgi:hypothetical protein
VFNFTTFHFNLGETTPSFHSIESSMGSIFGVGGVEEKSLFPLPQIELLPCSQQAISPVEN